MRVFLTIFLLIPVTIYSAETMPEQFLGRWEAYGTATRAVYGDLQVTKDSLSFKLLGSHTFIVLATFDDSVILEMSKSYPDDCGRFVRLGPIIQPSSDPIDQLWVGALNFTVYESKDEALVPKEIDPYTGRWEYPGGCAWGLYSPANINKASFDCSKANTSVEKLVCQDTELSELDSSMSDAYKRALTRTHEPSKLKEQQRRWLRDTRNRCSDTTCLKSAYTLRIEQLSEISVWMTNEKEKTICRAVINSINDGSIIRRIIPFELASEDDKLAWADSRPHSPLLYLWRTLKIDAHGKSITLGLVQGGGTCGNCDIEDINAPETEAYPPDDSEEHLRWKGWGQCDYFLFVEDEPIIVTGRFGWGESLATFAAWLAPDGAKRALCYLCRDRSKQTIIKITTNKDPKLCDAVTENQIEEIPWSNTASNPRKNTGGNASRWDSSKEATLDINLDGKKETILLFDYSSGAGCGSYRQWLREFTPQQRSAFPEEYQSNTVTPLEQIFAENGHGPIKNTKAGDKWHNVKLFRHAGKPYILAEGHESSAQVFSVWGNQKKCWCEYQVLPQHRVEVYYPIETWPALTISEFKKTKGAQALLYAAAKNNKEQVLHLVKNGTPIDFVNESGVTPLGQAVIYGHMDMAKLLLDNGASLDGVKGSRGSPLMEATRHTKVDLVKFLIDRGANVNAKNKKGFTPLMNASAWGNLEVVKLLIEKGADVNAKAKNGDTALKKAQNHRYTRIVKLLKAHGAKE